MFILALLLLVLGAVLIRRGARPPRTGHTPHCRRCNYILDGLLHRPATRCPECGLPLLDANVVFGERRRATRPIVAGILLLLLGAGVVILETVAPLRSINWYAHKPARWVIADLDTTAAHEQRRAWDELTTRDRRNRLDDADRAGLDAALVRLYAKSRLNLPSGADAYLIDRFGRLTPEQRGFVFDRLLADLTSNTYNAQVEATGALDKLLADHKLAPAQHEHLTAAALKAQREDPQSVGLAWMMDFVARRELADQLSPEQREAFFLACFNPTLEVRPTAIAGEDLPFGIRLNGRGSRYNSRYKGESRVTLLSTQIDNRAPVRQGGSMGGGLAMSGLLGSSIRTNEPGLHTLSVTFELKAFAGSAKGTPRWSRQMTLSDTFQILPKDTRDYVKWLDDRAMGERIRKAMRIWSVRASAKSPDAFAMMVQYNTLPADVAFEIFARDPAGNEHPVGQLAAAAGATDNRGINAFKFPPGPGVGTVDLIFRSSEKVVKGTTNLRGAWRGEIVFEKVPVAGQGN